jgi:hypothetical protein
VRERGQYHRSGDVRLRLDGGRRDRVRRSHDLRSRFEDGYRFDLSHVRRPIRIDRVRVDLRIIKSGVSCWDRTTLVANRFVVARF